MDVTIQPGHLRGVVRAPASKSVAHRALICAALADAPTLVACDATSQDTAATIRCLEALGARIEKATQGSTEPEQPDATDTGIQPEQLLVTPLVGDASKETVFLDCGESGSTLRFLLPVVGALGCSARMRRSGRLAVRPLAPFDGQLAAHGMTLADDGRDLVVSGRLQAGSFVLPGNVSSQYVTALLMASPALRKPVEVFVSTPVESRPYIDLTCSVMRQFGVDVAHDKVGLGENTHELFYTDGAPLRSPGLARIEGDWSNAAFWLAAGAHEACGLTVCGLDLASTQGDRSVLGALASFGARIARRGDAARATASEARASSLDVSLIPDLVPPLAAVASLSPGTSCLRNAGRLRLKESDRLVTICDAVNAMGGDARIVGDDLVVTGVASLRGGTVDAANDHRIAMMAAILATKATGSTTIRGAECVNKSYPRFWSDFVQLGGNIVTREE